MNTRIVDRDCPDAETFLVLFYSGYGAPPNYTRFKNAASIQCMKLLSSLPMIQQEISVREDGFPVMKKPVCPLY
jgi:hypothetical protein